MNLRGVNFGGWLLMEGYILGGRNIAESAFKSKFKKIYGKEELELFEREFRKRYITKDDFKRVSSWGANCIRLPFHYKFFENRPYRYNKDSIAFMHKIMQWAKECNLKIILDLHAACGCQNHDWHSDSTGKALLWEGAKYRDRTYALWEHLASTFRDEEALYGYDVVNEAVIDSKKLHILKRFYKKTIQAIRRSDKKNIIFLEGNRWGQEVEFLEDLLGENISLSIHTYQPLNFTFNFVRNFKYPGKIDNLHWGRDRLKKSLDSYNRFAQKNNTDIFVGEFGVNYRGGTFGEHKWLDDILSIFKQFEFGWTYWTYKATSNATFPDGIVQYLDNPPWVKREGPLYGLENIYEQWKANKKEILRSWHTDRHWVNKDIVNTLKRHLSP